MEHMKQVKDNKQVNDNNIAKLEIIVSIHLQRSYTRNM